MSVSVRYSRGGWVVDVSTRQRGKRSKRWIKAFGPGSQAKPAAEAYRDEIAPQARAPKFLERQTATFRDLWKKFDAQLVGPDPGPSTIADYRSMATHYLLPEFGDQRLREIDAEALIAFKTKLLTQPGRKAAAKQGSGKPLAARTVAKILTLIGTVFRFGKRIKLELVQGIRAATRGLAM
jgi:hypothetical protein